VQKEPQAGVSRNVSTIEVIHNLFSEVRSHCLVNNKKVDSHCLVAELRRSEPFYIYKYPFSGVQLAESC
jgi:hypothetical protein